MVLLLFCFRDNRKGVIIEKNVDSNVIFDEIGHGKWYIVKDKNLGKDMPVNQTESSIYVKMKKKN